MRGKTLMFVAIVVAAVLFVPAILRKMTKPATPPNVAQPPPQAPPVGGGKKKTVVGRIVAGATQLAGVIPHPSAANVAQGLGAIGSFTK